MKKHFYLVGILFSTHLLVLLFVPILLTAMNILNQTDWNASNWSKGELKEDTSFHQVPWSPLRIFNWIFLVRDSDSVGMFQRDWFPGMALLMGFSRLDRNYSDLHWHHQWRYLTVRANRWQATNRGSVGKLAVLTGLFTQLCYLSRLFWRSNQFVESPVIFGSMGAYRAYYRPHLRHRNPKARKETSDCQRWCVFPVWIGLITCYRSVIMVLQVLGGGKP